MSRHLERLLLIDSLIRTTQRPTSISLAQSLEVSERTVRSDLAFLRVDAKRLVARHRFNAPLEFNQQKGHHYTDSEWRLPSISLSKGELFALTLGARMLEAYAGSPYAPQLRSAIARISERLPETTWVNLQHVADEQILFRPGAEIDLEPEIWHKLEDACRTHKSVQMTYYTASRDAISERKLDPYLLHIYRGTNPYVIGYCHNRKQVRWFRVDRIKQLEVLTETFVQDPNFHAKEHLDTIFQHEVGEAPIPVCIWFDAKTAPYIWERRWHSTQEIEKYPDGSLTLKMTVRGINDLKRWVLWYGKGAIVKSPPELVQLVREDVEAMSSYYVSNGEASCN